MADARLVQLSNEYILNLADFQEAIFNPSDGDDPAKLLLIVAGGRTNFEDDEAITVWHRLRALCDRGDSDGR